MRLRNWLYDGNGCLVTGGQNFQEINRNARVSQELATLSRSGRVRSVSDRVLAPYLARIEGVQCRSDDQHILALALATGARLLVTRDKELHSDFKNSNIIKNPRGNIYQSDDHEQLLRRYCR